jgi:hypothetical protein
MIRKSENRLVIARPSRMRRDDNTTPVIGTTPVNGDSIAIRQPVKA